MTTPTTIAVIIGSGFPALAGEGEGRSIKTRFGPPSATIDTVVLEECSFLTLRRHGADHSIPPHAINYRANLSALQMLGAESVIALNTVGVITDVRESGELAVPDQVLDYTWGREHSVFDGSDGQVEHIDFTVPFSAALRDRLLAAATAADVDCFDGGVYAATQGPRLESAAEVDRLEKDGADYIGMTAMPEASIAMELGIDYACLAMVVNRAAGRSDTPIHQDVKASTEAACAATSSLLQAFFRSASMTS